MRDSIKEPAGLSPLMQKRVARGRASPRLAGAISKARARSWIRHIKQSRKEWK